MVNALLLLLSMFSIKPYFIKGKFRLIGECFTNST